MALEAGQVKDTSTVPEASRTELVLDTKTTRVWPGRPVFRGLDAALVSCECDSEVCTTATVGRSCFDGADTVTLAGIELLEVAFGQEQIDPEDSTEQHPVMLSWQT